MAEEEIIDINKGVSVELLNRRSAIMKELGAVNCEIAAARRIVLTEEPKCPECGSGVLRPKCMWEMGTDCPRHELVNMYGGATKLAERIKELKENG